MITAAWGTLTSLFAILTLNVMAAKNSLNLFEAMTKKKFITCPLL